MIRTIKLYGSLATDTGIDTLKLDVDSPQMMLLGLKALVPNFETSLRALDCPINIISANTTAGDKGLKGYSARGLKDSFGDADEICIVPEMDGAGVEIVAWYVGSTVAALTVTQIVIGIVISIAISAAVSAIAQSFAPKPDTSSGAQGAAQRPSFIFNGPVNVTKQGYAVPLVYGTCLVGSIVMSSGIDVVELQ